jgi:nitrite reductase/ring-hydroxylating ferredoxin subunit
LTAASIAAARVLAGTWAQLAAERVLLVRLAPDPQGRPREAIVVLDEHERPHGYMNLCRHLPIPLDAGSRRFLVSGEIQCATHGARYRLHDGYCITGPCRGTSLIRVEVEVTAALVFVVDER